MQIQTLLLAILVLVSFWSKEKAIVDSYFQGLSAQVYPDWANEMLDRVEELSSDKYQGRESGTEGGTRALEYVSQAFESESLGLFDDKRNLHFKTDNGRVEGNNVIGVLDATSTNESVGTILIGAHFDHVGLKSDEVFNGADDNASGTALMLAMADTLSKMTDRLSRFIFVAFDAEEKGLIGSRALVQDFPDLVKELDLMINFDMVSISDKNELYVSGLHKNPELKSKVDALEANANFTLLRGHDGGDKKDDWTFSSDHGPFSKAGVAHLYFGVEDHAHYHKATDNFANIDKDFYIAVGSAMREWIAKIAGQR